MSAYEAPLKEILFALEEVAGLSEVARLDVARPLIDRVLPFTDLPAAFARLASGEARGRVCLTRSGV